MKSVVRITRIIRDEYFTRVCCYYVPEGESCITDNGYYNKDSVLHFIDFNIMDSEKNGLLKLVKNLSMYDELIERTHNVKVVNVPENFPYYELAKNPPVI